MSSRNVASKGPTQERKSALLIAGLLLAYFLGRANWHHPVVRLDSPLANHLVLGLTLIAPVAALVLAWRATRGWQQHVVALVLTPLVLFGSFEGALVTFDTMTNARELSRGEDLGLEARSDLEVGAAHIVAYRTDCGATCSHGIELRIERRLLPGLRLVRSVASWYPAEDAILQIQGTQHVLVTVQGLRRGSAQPATLALTVKPWVYY